MEIMGPVIFVGIGIFLVVRSFSLMSRGMVSKHWPTVYYNPDNPTESVLIPGVTLASFLIGLTGMGCIFDEFIYARALFLK